LGVRWIVNGRRFNGNANRFKGKPEGDSAVNEIACRLVVQQKPGRTPFVSDIDRVPDRRGLVEPRRALALVCTLATNRTSRLLI
jgi:hypothetical protein